MAQNIEHFGTTSDGKSVERISISNGVLRGNILTYGATVQDLRIEGHTRSLVLGAPTLEPYLGPMTYFGALVGRFANRIAHGRFELDGKRYQVPCNWIGKHALHGGKIGTGQRVWDIVSVSESSVKLRIVLTDGEMGFPGELSVIADIHLTDDGALGFDISATTTKTTPCSFAHHGYFNLDGGADISSHRLQIDAPAYLPVDNDLIPTGEIRPVEGTDFDFREFRLIGQRGLDHNFCLQPENSSIRPVARLHGSKSGIMMTIETNQPGLQVYDGAYIPKQGLNGLDGFTYGPYAGIALETQAWPDAPNRPDFPPAIVRPGEKYRHQVRYAFEKNIKK